MKHFKLALIAAVVSQAFPAVAQDAKAADAMEVSFHGTLTAGTTIRTEDPNPANYALIPSTMVPGVAPGQYVGQTGGSDLNTSKGQAVSTVVKALVDLDIHGKNLGLFVRANAWNDSVQGHNNVAYGNYANGYKTNSPLSDNGFAPEAKFSNAVFRDAYLYGKFDLGEQGKLDARVGRQVLNWGTSQFFTGGIGAGTNPLDLAAQLRPGALPQEGKLPVGMVSLSFNSGKEWGIDGYVPYEFRSTALPGCGTFFDTATIVQAGCNLAGAVGAPVAGTPLASLSTLTEQSLLGSGYYLHRAPDGTPSDSGQYGLSVRYAAPSLNTEFRGYLMNSHQNLPNIFRVTVENVGGATLPAGLGGGLARLTNANGLKYGVVFPESTQTVGASFDSKLGPATRVFGELAYRPNQPLPLTGTDMLTGFLLRAPNSLLQLQKGILSIPAGSSFDGFDRYAVTTANLGINQVFPKALGAERVVLAAEVGLSNVAGLPDPSILRYGRALAFGAAPYQFNGALTVCAETAPGLNGVPGKTCTFDGFVSSNAWGLRARVSATYADALLGAALTPSLTLTKDMVGYSYDGTFSEGRLMTRIGLRADWGRRYFADVTYTGLSGGNYNLAADRSNFTFAAGMNF